MNRLLFLSLALFIGSGLVFAQEEADLETEKTVPEGLWQKEAVANANFSNTVYSENWAAGGEDAITWNIKLNGKVERDAEKTSWKSTGKLEFGQTKLGDANFRKSLDRIYFETLYLYKLTELLNPYAAGTAESQFIRGYKYEDDSRDLVSNFWDPGYLTQSAGLGLVPVKDLITRLGFSLKETFSDQHGYADDPSTLFTYESAVVEPGLESVTDYSAKFHKIVLYTTKLNVFVNFQGVEEIDGKWENLLTVQFSRYVNINFGFDWLYDLDQDDSDQRRQNLSVGLNYSFL